MIVKYDIFILDEESNILFKCNEEFYIYLKDNNAIYYSNDIRCICFNKILGESYNNICSLLYGLCKIKSIDEVFDKEITKLEDFNKACNDDNPVELNFNTIEKLRDITKR